VRSSSTPTRVSGPTPIRRNPPASSSARRSSSA